ncbi:tetratricopeptide repeat protein [bacterium]|nr:tetratricopeptide repeat protein [bacterium]
MPSRQFMTGLPLLLVLLATTPAAAQDAAADSVAGGIRLGVPAAEENMTDEDRIAMLNQKLTKNPADAKAWNDLGVIYANQEKYDLARDSFIRAVQSSPLEGDYHRNLGMVFSRLGDFDMAVAEYGQYRKFDQLGGQDYWRLIGGAQKDAGMLDQARATFAEGLKAFEPDLGPEGFRLVLQLNQLEAEQGDDQAVRDLLEARAPVAERFLAGLADNPDAEAEDGYREARSIVHNRVNLMVDDAKLMEDSGLFPDAARLYKQAYEMTPGRDDLLPRLVDCYLKQDMQREAGVAARRAREDHPDKAGTWIATGKVYEQTSRREDAVAAYEQAYEIEPLDDVRVAIGNLYMRMGNDKEASKWLKAGVSGSDAKPEVVYNYAVSLMREEKFHAAIPSLRNVVRDKPDFYNGWIALAQCLQMTKQYAAAVEPYQQAFNLQPDARTAFHMGSMAQKADQFEKAVSSYEMAIALDPTYDKAQYNLALSYMGAKRYEDAVAAFDKLIEIEGPSYRAYYSQGLSYYYLGRYDEALEAYDSAMAEKETVNVFNNIGLVYDKLGNKKEAAKWYKDAQALKGGG